MDTPLYSGTADRPPFPPPVILRLRRVRAVIDVLGDSLDSDCKEYSAHLCDRATVCEMLSDELLSITRDLEEEG